MLSPSVSNLSLVNFYVFQNSSLELTCPVQVGNVHTLLNPYHLSWERILIGNVTVLLINDSRSVGFTLSPDNVTLTIPVSSSSIKLYRCNLYFRQCNNTVLCRVQRYFDPHFSVNVIILAETTFFSSFFSF